LATPNIKEDIKKLVELQGMDKKIFDAKRELAEAPKVIVALESDFESKKANLKAIEEKRQKLILFQKQKEGDLAAKEEGIKKAQGQLGLLKTNKDYQAKLAEIEGLKADKSLIEEEVLRTMDEIDGSKGPIEAEKTKLATEEKAFQEKKSQISHRTKDLEAQVNNLEGQRKVLSSSVDKKILERYEHILPAKEGVALVRVAHNSCQGCFMHVPHQVINEIQMHDRLIVCENCARILYLEEDVLT
jgi:predicted  nucleic acid-binding Zn-ribbon protein